MHNESIAKMVKIEQRYEDLANTAMSISEKTSLLARLCSEYEISYKGFCYLEKRLIRS